MRIAAFDWLQRSGFSADAAKRKLVLILHGIRDEGNWIENLAEHIQDRCGVRAIQVSPGWIRLTWFLVGARFLGYVKKFTDEVAATLRNSDATEVIFIAHSYGTWCLADMLNNWGFREIRPVKILLCGSVLPANFDWEAAFSKSCGSLWNESNSPWVWNDVGGADPFPALAGLLQSGYGDAGVNGFKCSVPNMVVNRRHRGVGHSGFFVAADQSLNTAFVDEYWLPVIESGDGPRSGQNPGTAPWIIALSYWIRTWWELALAIGAVTVGLVLVAGVARSTAAAAGGVLFTVWVWLGFQRGKVKFKVPLYALCGMALIVGGVWTTRLLLPPSHAETLLRLTEDTLAHGDIDSVRSRIDELDQLTEEKPRSPARVRFLLLKGLAESSPTQGQRILRQAKELCDQLPRLDHKVRVSVLNALGRAELQLGNTEVARNLFEEARSLASTSGTD